MDDLNIDCFIIDDIEVEKETPTDKLVYYCPADGLASYDKQTWVPLEKFYSVNMSQGPKYRLGDRVYRGGNEGMVYKVLEPSNWGDWEERYSYEIVYADPSIPKEVVLEQSLSRELMDSNGWTVKCQCGVDSVGAGIHSDWCPKSYKNVTRL